MRAISINNYMKMCCHLPVLISIEGHTLNTYWILEVNVEIWGDQKMVVWRPEHYRSLNPPILADSQDPPFSRLLISWIYWIYNFNISNIYFGRHPRSFLCRLLIHPSHCRKTNNGPDERKGANVPVPNSVKWGLWWKYISWYFLGYKERA